MQAVKDKCAWNFVMQSRYDKFVCILSRTEEDVSRSWNNALKSDVS